MKNKYAQFYTLLSKSGQEKEDLILSFTSGRKSSLRELTDKEYNALCASLRKAVMGEQPYIPLDNPKGDTLRKAIISCFHTMNRPRPAIAAKEWAEKMGVGSGESNTKKPFNHYTNQELMILLTKARKAVEDYQTAIRKRLK